jgi:hypothetical protein
VFKVLKEIEGVGRNQETLVEEWLDPVEEERMPVFVRQKVGIGENGQSVDALEVVQPTAIGSHAIVKSTRAAFINTYK